MIKRANESTLINVVIANSIGLTIWIIEILNYSMIQFQTGHVKIAYSHTKWVFRFEDILCTIKIKPHANEWL